MSSDLKSQVQELTSVLEDFEYKALEKILAWEKERLAQSAKRVQGQKEGLSKILKDLVP